MSHFTSLHSKEITFVTLFFKAKTFLVHISAGRAAISAVNIDRLSLSVGRSGANAAKLSGFPSAPACRAAAVEL